MSEPKKANTLKSIEAEVLNEGREWMRQRLQQRLQAEADAAGALFPPPATAVLSPDPAHRRGASDVARRLRPESGDQ
jgi:hypothetical protein